MNGIQIKKMGEMRRRSIASNYWQPPPNTYISTKGKIKRIKMKKWGKMSKSKKRAFNY